MGVEVGVVDAGTCTRGGLTRIFVDALSRFWHDPLATLPPLNTWKQQLSRTVSERHTQNIADIQWSLLNSFTAVFLCWNEVWRQCKKMNSYAVYTRDTFTWGKLTFLLYCVTFSMIVKWHLPHVNVSRVTYTEQFFVQLDSQRLKAYHCSCTNRGVTLCNGSASNLQKCDRGGPRRG